LGCTRVRSGCRRGVAGPGIDSLPGELFTTQRQENPELLQPTAGNNSSYENYLRAENQAQDEIDGAIDAQGPGITTNGDNNAGTGEDDNGG
jgi:hypothetical protein